MNQRKWMWIAAVGLLAVAARFAGDDPVNKECPVSGKPVDPAVTVSYEGKTVGFCCKGCVKKFNADPKSFAAKLGIKAPEGGAPAAELGKPAPDFTLADTDGKKVSLSSFKGKIVVLEWINPGCPFCKRVFSAGLVRKMLGDLKSASSDAVWLPISSTASLEAGPIAGYLKDNGIEAQALMDGDGVVGKLYDAKTTPHLFVIDKEGVLRYTGAFDNDPSGKKTEGVENYAVGAVKQIVAGQKVSPEATKPYGCSVKYKK